MSPGKIDFHFFSSGNLAAIMGSSIAELRLADDWPEYYDGKHGRLIGKSSRKFQTWTIAGWLLAELLRENPNYLNLVCIEEDTEAIACII